MSAIASTRINPNLVGAYEPVPGLRRRAPRYLQLSLKRGVALYFMSPAAVRARVITAPTSMPRRRLGCGAAAGFSAFNGHRTMLRLGTSVDTGDASGISLALGDSIAARAFLDAVFFAVGFLAPSGSRIHSVKPKKFAI
jgi:hypothetical protein